MTALGSITAGARLTAAILRGVAPLAAIKGADQTLTSSTTLQNDSALLATLAASASYLFVCYLDFEGPSSNGLKWSWSVPAGCTMRYTAAYTNLSGVATVGGYTNASIPAGNTTGAGNLQGLLMAGTALGGLGGTLQLQWAQNASSGTATIVHAQSVLALWQVA